MTCRSCSIERRQDQWDDYLARTRQAAADRVTRAQREIDEQEAVDLSLLPFVPLLPAAEQDVLDASLLPSARPDQ